MNKSFWILVLFVVIALGGGFWLLQEPVTENKKSELVFKDFRKTVDELQAITITNAQGQLLDAELEDGQWVTSVRAGLPKYPVSKKYLAELLQTLTQVKLLEAKTSKTENFSQLGLQALYAEDSIASLITLKAGNSSKSLMVGKMATSGHGSFVRKPSETQTWLADKYIEMPVDKFAWLQQPILPYQGEDIVSISRVDHDYWSITRDTQDSSLKLSDMPQNSELKYEAVLNSIFSALVDLRFESLLDKENELIRSLDILTELEVHTLNNVFFKLTLGKRDGQHFIHFSSLDGDYYWSHWVYQISNFSAQQLVKSMKDFLKDNSSAQTESDSEVTQYSIDEGESPN